MAPKQKQKEEISPEEVQRLRQAWFDFNRQQTEKFMQHHADDLSKIAGKYRLPTGLIKVITGLLVTGRSPKQVQKWLTDNQTMVIGYLGHGEKAFGQYQRCHKKLGKLCKELEALK